MCERRSSLDTLVEERTHAAAEAESEPLLRVTDLVKRFPITSGILFQRTIGMVHAVEGVSFAIEEGETFGLVGESGCGKTTTGRCILQLYRPTSGSVLFEGRELTEAQWQGHAGSPSRHADRLPGPVRVAQPAHDGRHHRGGATDRSTRSARGRSARSASRSSSTWWGSIRSSPTATPTSSPAGSGSGSVWRARLALNPKLIICDEPVSALDVSIQAQILNLFEELQSELGLTYLFIAHNLSVVKHISDRVGVMYLGKMMEIAPSEELYANPVHPYTMGLLGAIPIPDPMVERARARTVLEGDVPSPVNPPKGCVFHPRCFRAQARLRPRGSRDGEPRRHSRGGLLLPARP